jgi:two-component system CheB/CheR fusion protein
MTDNPPEQPDRSPAQTAAPFAGHVVCIGASAGGLDALERFFGACPVDTGAAFVVVQHLSPDHKSMMNTLLSRHTQMPVIMVEEDMVLKANQVYLIPPGSIMHVSPGRLHLKPKKPQVLTLPIDIFYASLAEVYRELAVGIILSGTGTDGTRGAVAIHEAGGFLMAQEPESSKFDGMPRSHGHG